MEVRDAAKDADIGVIIGRFQVHALHEMHIDLIQTVRSRHKQVIILLGLAPTKVTKNNPLDYQARRAMISEKFPDVHDIYYIDDQKDDLVWSKNVDREVMKHVPGESNVVLYGSRDSFLSHYKGRFQVRELVSDRVISGSELRKTTGHKRRSSEDFRAGVIWAVENQYDHVWPTVDCAILDDNGRILLGRKAIDSGKYRLIGGFVKTTLPSLEANVKAEVSEETHVEIGTPRYLGSAIIDDWRYRAESGKIMTSMFVAKYIFGAPQADDDIDEVRWFQLADIKNNADTLIVEGHRKLIAMLHAWLDAGNTP